MHPNIVNPDKEIRRGYSQLVASTRRTSSPSSAPPSSAPEASNSAPATFPPTNMDNNLHEYAEAGIGSGVVGSLASVQLPPSNPADADPPPTNDRREEDRDDLIEEDQDDSNSVGILDLPSPPTFLPVEEDDDIDAEEEMINRVLEGSSSRSLEPVVSEEAGASLKPSQEDRVGLQNDRVVLTQMRAFSASASRVQLQEYQKEEALFTDQGDLSKYLRFIATREQTHQDEEIGAIVQEHENHEDREVRPRSSPVVIRQDAILVMGMTVQGTETDQPTGAQQDEFEWIDDAENGKTFKVSKNLTVDPRVQGRFLTKIMCVKAIQAAVICLWFFIVGQVESLQSAVVISHDWAFFVAGGLFVALFIVTRLMGRRKSKWHFCPITLMLLLMTSIMAYFLASARYRYDLQIVSFSVWILLGACLLMTIVPFMCDCIAAVANWGHTGVVVTLLSGVTVLLISMFAKRSLDIRQFTLYTWFPSLFVAEIILWVMLWELRCIVQGYAFKASEARWYFAALWV